MFLFYFYSSIGTNGPAAWESQTSTTVQWWEEVGPDLWSGKKPIKQLTFWPLRKQAAYKQATRGPMALCPFRGIMQWG